MPKWISVEKAVIKYHIEKEAILLWVEMGQFPMLYIEMFRTLTKNVFWNSFAEVKPALQQNILIRWNNCV